MTAPARSAETGTDLSPLVAALMIRADHQADCIRRLIGVVDELAERVEMLELHQLDHDS